MPSEAPIKRYSYNLFNGNPFRLPVVRIVILDRDYNRARAKSVFMASHMLFANANPIDISVL